MHQKLQRTDSSFACVQCDSAHAVGALRYRIEMDIADDTAEGKTYGEPSDIHHHTHFDERDRVPFPTSLTMEGTTMMVATCQVIIQFLLRY
ncbi:hypothetical protein Bca52824_055520 [Brassica carinata]|uniref:Uncharacterized protein n=1 Tax=Brassica carinata TaxID=52824 RepID=A0A8X7R9H8_BRACI|nr:hypothetical protein Bca52824_055520 [Brassica carinata]